MIPDDQAPRRNFELMTCHKRTPERGLFNIEELTEDEILFYWALIQQEANTEARKVRRQWRVISGGKPGTPIREHGSTELKLRLSPDTLAAGRFKANAWG